MVEANQAQQIVVQPKPATKVVEAVGMPPEPPVSAEHSSVARILKEATSQNYTELLAGLSNTTGDERDKSAPEGGQI